eukprot:GHVS01088101.1.p1 GENE.GHVS01088101.1~~GHVS01088101.1.p1  ORF type:complete len:146 (-),score=25.20 GHVS01088101.1:42-479(-)
MINKAMNKETLGKTEESNNYGIANLLLWMQNIDSGSNSNLAPSASSNRYDKRCLEQGVLLPSPPPIFLVLPLLFCCHPFSCPICVTSPTNDVFVVPTPAMTVTIVTVVVVQCAATVVVAKHKTEHQKPHQTKNRTTTSLRILRMF